MAGHPKHQTDSTAWSAERLVPSSVPWHKKRMINEHVRRYEFACTFVKDKKVIDLACGTGYGCLMMLQSGAASVFGVDINAEAIRYARKYYHKSGITYLGGDVTRTSLPSKSANVVTSFETIEHLQDDVAFIKEVRRLLKPNGIFIMSTPNREFSTGSNPYHVREYTSSECEDLLKNFSSIKRYGQRKVNRKFFIIMKKFPLYTDFRPWEKVHIEEITQDINYCYFIFVCTV